jgi:hypothetical protein
MLVNIFDLNVTTTFNNKKKQKTLVSSNINLTLGVIVVFNI